MRKFLMAAIAAVTLTGSLAASAAPAAAQSFRHFNGGHRFYGNRRGDDAGAAIAGGILGFALGAAVNGDRGYYDGGYYHRGYYDGGYYDGYAPYATCEAHRRVWDRYIGRWVWRNYAYAC